MGSEIIQDEEAMKRIEDWWYRTGPAPCWSVYREPKRGSCAGKFTAATLRTHMV